MASRVNTKFVVILAGALAMVFVATAGVFYYVKMRSGVRYAHLGDQAIARGDVAAADEFYSKAVSKEPTNVEYLRKWRGVMEKRTPEKDIEYLDAYRMYTAGVLSSLAKVQRTDVAAQTDLLEALYSERIAGIGREGWERIIGQANESLSYFEPEQPPAIRRYRGMATLGLQSVGAEVKPDQLDGAVKDLEAAIAANPRDTEAAQTLAFLHRAGALKAKERGDRERHAQLMASAKGVAAAALQANPGDPEALVTDLVIATSEIDDASGAGSASEQRQARVAAIQALEPRVAAVGEQLVKVEPARLKTQTVSLFTTMAVQIARAEGIKQAQAVTARALEGAPDNADLLILAARLAMMQGDLKGATAHYESVLKLPKRPISLAGVRLGDTKRRAQFLLTNAIVGLASGAKDDARPAALEAAKRSREDLAKVVPERSPELHFIDAKLLMVNNDLRAAQERLSEFMRTPGDLGPEQMLDAHLLMGHIAMRLDPPQPGLARDSYRKVLESRPDLVNVRLMLAEIEFRLDNRAMALKLYKDVLEAEPGNETAKRQVQILEARTDDPVLRTLIEADALARGTATSMGDDKAALALVEGALEANNHDPRLVTAAVTLRVASDDYAGARETVTAALRKRPGDEALSNMLKRLSAADSAEAMISLVEESSAAPLEKWLTKRRLYNAYGKTAEAATALQEAAKLSPDDPRVLELMFVEAVLAKNEAEATRLAERATKVNADRAEGDTYKARVLLMQGNMREAAALLERATQRGNANPAIYRLLGSLQFQLGRGADSVASYRKALELNPADVQSVKAYLTVLVQAGQTQTALAAARASEAVARRDPEFVSMWLELEAGAGRVQFARERREEVLARSPSDQRNNAALADLYIRERSFDKARTLIDALRAKNDSIAAVSLDARWHSAKGDVEAAAAAFGAYVEKAQGPDRARALVAQGQFLVQSGRVQDGIAAYRKAAEFQDPKTLSVDQALGDVMLSHGLFADAEVQFRKVLKAGVEDPQHQLRKRLIEALINQGKLKEAEAEFAALGPAAERDVELIAQRAQVLRDLGRSPEARDLLDRAIEKFPDEPLPYFRRARQIMGDPAYLADAMADLGTAIKLRPTYWQALRTRGQLYIGARKFDEAIKDWQAAADAAPALDEVRLDLVSLLLEQNRDTDATAAAEAGMKLHADDLRYTATLAERFAARGRWAKVAGFYKQMLAQRADPSVAAACVDAYLKSTPPAIGEAEAVLSTPGLTPDKSWELLIARASIRKKQGKDGPMQADCVKALELAATPVDVAASFEAMRRVVVTPGTIIQIVERAWGGRQADPTLGEWMSLARFTAMLDDPPQRSEGVSQLQSLAAKAKDLGVRVNAAKGAGAALMNDSRWEEAVAVAKAGLGADPDDVVFNNNVAFLLSENLHKPAEALPFAEKALQRAPSDLNVIDTACAVYWSTGDREKAVGTASTGLRVPRPDADKAPLALRLAGWKLQLGDKPGAKALLEFLLEVLSDNPSTHPDFKAKVEQLKKDIDAAA